MLSTHQIAALPASQWDGLQFPTPWGEIGYITYKRTYARKLDSNNPTSPTEEFYQTVERVIDACRDQLHVGFTLEEEKRLRYYLLNLKSSVAGRFWWQLGTKTVDRLGLLSLQNCAYTNVDHPIRPFTWAFDALMLGSGVGFGIQKRHISKLPAVRGRVIFEEVHEAVDFTQEWAVGDERLATSRSAQHLLEEKRGYIRGALQDVYVIGDSREGWIAFLEHVLEVAFFGAVGQNQFRYTTACVRPKDSIIRGFGGTASGASDLVWGIKEIVKILNSRFGQQLTSVNCLDIMNIIGKIVVAGNVRRSAQIAIGDKDDVEFLQAKAWWKEGGIPNWRNMSNNSIEADSMVGLCDEFWETYERGEPYGVINLNLARNIGRIDETQYPDPKVDGFNPCAEQGLEDKETCALAEEFIPRISSLEEMMDITMLHYRIVKHSLRLPCHLKDTEEVVHRNMRMGIGQCGTLAATAEQLSWLSPTYEALRAYDVDYSAQHGWPVSIKLTTVKPGGTLALLPPGIPPGAHPMPAGPKYIRRMRMDKNSPVLQQCIEAGFPVEPQREFDGTDNPNTFVVSFPCSVPDHTKVAGSISAIEHLEHIKFLQANWSDNSVSCSVYYTPEELPEIKQWLAENFTFNVKTVSFLLYHGHGFDQAPYETISEIQYDLMKMGTTPITDVQIDSEEALDGADCLTGACPTR